MFETSSTEVVIRKGRPLFYETLPLSIFVHAVAAVGVMAAANWAIQFPTASPRLVSSYFLIRVPDPPPPPPPPAPPKAVQPQPQTPRPPDPQQIVAPTVIPDVIPLVPDTPIQTADKGVPAGVEGGVEGGVVGGIFDGVKGGEVGGSLGGTPGGIIDKKLENRVVIERDKHLPLFPLSQVYPIYPEEARLRNIEGSLVVRYVIGTDGRVKEVTVVDHAEKKIFEDAAVKAIRYWRFRPLMKDGKPVEVVHELTVYFRLNDRGEG
ncbi:MAG TPA: TonB family protein [Thermoanaerobaculia bacterium]|nr:TonB family protein [Thermoanaerobaculia bacterium]